MEKLLMFLVICVFAKAVENTHPKFVRGFEEYERSDPEFEEGSACEVGDNERHTLTDEAKCGEPKKVLHSFRNVPRAAHEEVKKVNTKTSKESCATFLVEEHEECACSTAGRSKTGGHKYGKSKIAVF